MILKDTLAVLGTLAPMFNAQWEVPVFTFPSLWEGHWQYMGSGPNWVDFNGNTSSMPLAEIKHTTTCDTIMCSTARPTTCQCFCFGYSSFQHVSMTKK